MEKRKKKVKGKKENKMKYFFSQNKKRKKRTLGNYTIVKICVPFIKKKWFSLKSHEEETIC